MARGFSDYQEEERNRRGLLLGAAAAVGAAFAIPIVRKGAATVLLGGVSALGRRYGRGITPLKLSGLSTELEGLLERSLPRVARASLATETAVSHLAKEGVMGISESAAIYARQLATTTAFQRFLNTQATHNLEKVMRDKEVLGILGRHAAAVHVEELKLNPAAALDKVLADQRFRIENALEDIRRNVPTLESARTARGTLAAREEITRLAGRHLDRMAAPSFLDKVLGKFGVSRVRVGQVSEQPDVQDIIRRLGTHVSTDTLNALPIGSTFRAGGGLLKGGVQDYDLRGVENIINRGSDWFRANFQIPISPGMRGIPPGQLFPWRRGKINRTFATAQQFGRDPVGRALLESTTDRLGKDIFKVGDRFVGVDFKGGLAGELNVDADFYTGLYGAIKRRSMAVNAAQTARSKEIESWTDLFINRDWKHTEIGERASFFTKFRDPRWAPNLFKNILGGDISKLTGEDIERAGHFLQSQGLPTAVQEELAKSTTFGVGQKEFDAHTRNLMTDEGVLGFFGAAAKDEGFIEGLKSHRLRSHIRQFQTSPAATLSQGRPSVDFDTILSGISGVKGDKTGIDLMRDAIADELVAQHGETFTNWARGQKFSPADVVDTLAYGHGRVLLGEFYQQQGSIKAVNYLRDSEEVRGDVSTFVKKHVKAWDFFRQPDTQTLNTAELLVPKGRNPVVDLFNAINEARKAGESPLNAIVNIIKSPTIGQYTAFFTGNQANITATTIGMEHIPRRVEQYFQTAGLGLPARDLLSGGSIFSNLILKRILPVVAAYEGYRYADYKLHQAGINGPSDIYANLRSRAGLTRASLTGGNLLGLGKRELFPGLERLLPDRTVEEEQEFQKSGYEPVRRGRFWLIGSKTPVLGDKVSYFLPSAVQVTRSHWQETETSDLNTKAYWKNSFLPTPENLFLGPLNPFRDPNWFEKRHAIGSNADRPAILSGEAFDPATPQGPLLNATIGQIIKPTRVLHPEYLPKSLGGSASREHLRALNEAQKQGRDVRGTGLLVGGAVGGHTAGIGGGVSVSGIGSPGIVGTHTGTDTGSIATITAGGQLQPLSLPSEITNEQWQALGQSTIKGQGGTARLSHRELARINRLTKAGIGGLTKVRPSAVTHMFEQHEPFSDEDLDLVNYRSGTIQTISDISELSGLYGFMFRAGMEKVGLPIKQRGKVIGTTQPAYGYNRRLHELGLGSFGEGVTEVFRRFMNKPEQEDIYNPVPNMMPVWLPGPEYFTDFRHGDPYLKIPRGELRLPGAAYEAIHHPHLLQTRASSIGKDIPDIMRQMLFIDQPMSDYGAEATEVGTAMHKVLQRKWKRMGILVGAEEKIDNSNLGISGHYDAILRATGGDVLVDIKTVNQRRFEEAKRHPFAEHVSQINYYLHEKEVSRGALLYVNRDKPWEVATQELSFDPGLFKRDISKVKEARHRILGLVERGTLTRGDLYSPITRFEILADTSPYSEQYASLRQYLTEKNKAGELTEEENKSFQAAKKRVAQQKKTVEITPYRFSNIDLQYKTVTVDKILDPNTIAIRGDEHPLRLAGLRSSNERIEKEWGEAPEGVTPAEWQFEKLGIRRGSRLRVAVEGDPEKQISRDVLRTQHAVVFRGGRNVNKELIESGVGTEKETDYSSTGVTARFTPGEITKGKVFEAVSHLDNPIINKTIRNRSPLEELERGIVYGKNTGSWLHPFRDFVSPTLTSYLAKNPIAAGLGVGGFAAMFMRTKEGKKWALLGGAAVGAAASLIRMGAEQATGGTYKPIRTNKREALEEYWDILKYVKYRGLAAREEKAAKKEEHTDIEGMSRQLYNEGQKRERRRNWLAKRKRELILEDKAKNQKEISDIQGQIERTEQQQGALKLGPHGTRALQYRELYRSTLYGITAGETPFLNMFRAFPKYKRELIQGFIEKSSKGERERIYKLLPRQEQRVIGGYMGIDKKRIPDRPILRQYFRQHNLPGPGWAGWKNDIDLEQMRQIAIRGERLDPLESGINDRQIDEAQSEIHDIPVPSLQGSSTQIQAKLNEILSGRGLKGIRVNVDVQPHDGDRDHVSVGMHIKQRRENDLLSALNMIR